MVGRGQVRVVGGRERDGGWWRESESDWWKESERGWWSESEQVLMIPACRYGPAIVSS